ncbi:unnamed protein product [Rotaria socialis]|uniref:Uncharacterized protein n=1 Tax=Rotaria socialis TaxID=392032 RepID=A0A820JM61_9BILA|nr:unnamed protein product [Rotaria socialis]
MILKNIFVLVIIAISTLRANAQYPVPIPPGGRMAVHGWLILPWNTNATEGPIQAWFSHHVPEFGADSPHNFQIVLNGTLTVRELTTAVYLNESTSVPSYPDLRYLSYPRDMSSSGDTKPFQHMYFAHEIHSVPDFDHIIHVSIDTTQCHCEKNFPLLCNSENILQQIRTPGVEWSFPTLTNDLQNRLLPPTVIKGRITSGPVLCPITVLESIHCMIGPDFNHKC